MCNSVSHEITRSSGQLFSFKTNHTKIPKSPNKAEAWALAYSSTQWLPKLPSPKELFANLLQRPAGIEIRPSLRRVFGAKLGSTACLLQRMLCNMSCKAELLPNMPHLCFNKHIYTLRFDLALTALYDFTVPENIPF